MISTSHANAREMFERDVNGVVKFFAMKMHYVPSSEEIPKFDEVRAWLGWDGMGWEARAMNECVTPCGWIEGRKGGVPVRVLRRDAYLSLRCLDPCAH